MAYYEAPLGFVRFPEPKPDNAERLALECADLRRQVTELTRRIAQLERAGEKPSSTMTPEHFMELSRRSKTLSLQINVVPTDNASESQENA